MSDHENDIDRDLRNLFAPRRPDPERFASGVAARLAAANDSEPETPASSDEAASRFSMRRLLDRAAAIVPGLSTGVGAGKSWPVILSLPLLLLIGAVATFAHGLRRADPRHHAERPTPTPRERRIHDTLLQGLPAAGSLMGMVVMGCYLMFGGGATWDTITLLLTVAMLGLIWHIGQVAGSGSINAVHLGRTVLMLFVGVMLLPKTFVYAGDSVLGEYAASWILVAGIIVAALLVARIGGGLDPGLLLILFIALPLGALTLHLPIDLESRIRNNLSAMTLEPKNLTGWQSAQTMAHALAASGCDPASMEHLRDSLAAAIEAIPTKDRDDPVHPAVWTSALELGILDRNQLRKIMDREFIASRVDRLLDPNVPLPTHDYRGYLLDTLLATRDLSAAQRDELANRIAVSLSTPTEFGHPLERTMTHARWLDQLDRRDLVLAHSESIHALLREHWVSADEATWLSTPGGFCTDPENKSSSTSPTVEALELIDFVGAPDSISLLEVQAFLRSKVRTSLIGRAIARSELSKVAEAGLLLLQRSIGLPERSWFAALVGERANLAALLLVLLALRAVWMAHRCESTTVGAQP